MSIVHSSFNLLRNSTQRKYFFRWLESLQKDYFLKKKQPWLTFDAIDYLNSLQLEGKRVFEYGSGGSTLYWLTRQMITVSIEHDPKWYKLVRSYLDSSTKIDYRLVQPEPTITEFSKNFANPDLYLSEDNQFLGFTFRSYASQIDEFLDEYFDVVLIDGRARPSCIKHCISKVKYGGLLIIDNSERSYYFFHTSIYLNNFQKVVFHGVTPAVTFMSSTTVYIKTY